MKNLRIAVAALAAVVLLTSWAIAGPGRGWGRGMGPCGDGSLAEELNLTPEQSQKIEELRQSRFEEMAAMRDEMAQKRAELRGLWENPNPNQAEILAKERELNQLRGRFQENATRHQFALRGILTPEQIEKMTDRGGCGGFGMGPGGDYCGKGPGRGGRMQGRWQ